MAPTFLFCLTFLSNSNAADTEVRRLLEASIKKAINAASEGGLESKDMEEITLLFEFDETKKILAEDSSLFEFLAEKPITRLRPDGLTPDQLNAARKLDARKSLMVEFLVKNGAGKALQAKNGQFPGADYIEIAAKAAGSQSVKALLEAGCDSQIKRQAGTPALTAAAGNAWLFPESVPLLLKAGASALGGDDSTAEPLSALLQNYCDSITYFPPAAVARLTPTEAASIVGNCETTVSLLIKSQAAVSNALKFAIEKGYSKAVTAMLASPQAPESGTMLKWLISAKLSNVNYDPASFASIRDAISKHKEQMATGGSAATAEGAQKLGLPLVRAFFHGGTKTEGSELWTTDGTADGTKMVADLEPGSGSSDLKHFVPVEGGMAFIGSTREKKTAIYRVDNDGTTVDSMMWENNVSEVGSAENRMVLFDNRPPKQVRGLGLLWQSDGTPNGTFPIAHDKLKVLQVDPRSNRFFFWFQAGPTFKEGFILAELKPTQRQIVQHAKVMNLGVFGNPKFLAGPEHFIWFNELGMWAVKQGSAALPELLFEGRQIMPDLSYGLFRANAKGLLFFPARYMVDSARGPKSLDKFGVELWCTNGTLEGTKMVKDIIAGPDDQKGSTPAGLTAFGEKIIFSADDGAHGREPWLSDGTEQGTQLMVDLEQGPRGSYPVGFTPFDTKVVFFAGQGLWVTDGTDSGTTKLKSFDQIKVNSMVNAGGCLLFEAQSGAEERGLWRTDGTLGGTRFLKEVTIASPIAVVPQPTAPESTKP